MSGPGPAPRLRPARIADVPACVEVFHRSWEALVASRREPVPPRNSPPLVRLFEHLVTTDPEGAWLAEATSGVVGFALAHRRADRWFLGFLFVLEGWQGRGVGRALLERALPDPSERRSLGVCVEAIQPVSTALYARYGMVPRLPLYLLSGSLERRPLPTAPERLAATPFAALEGPAEMGEAVEGSREGRLPGGELPGGGLRSSVLRLVGAVDRAVHGFERPLDHAFWRATGRVGLLFHVPGGGADDPVGYGYAQPSGRIGPVVVREPGLLAPALAELTAAVTVSDGWQVIVPGVAADALLPLLRAGMRIEGGPAVYAATWAGPPFDRYLPMSHALI
jgi:GNAT superfamily N-acetyltransferase